MRTREEINSDINAAIARSQGRIQQKTQDLVNRGFIDDPNKPKYQSGSSADTAQQLLGIAAEADEQSPVPEYNIGTLGDRFTNVLPTVGSGITGAVNDFATLAALANAAAFGGTKAVYSKLTDGDYGIDDFEKEMNYKVSALTKYPSQATDYFRNNYSTDVQKAFAKRLEIENNPNLSEAEQAAATANWWLENKEAGMTMIGENVIRNIIGAKGLGKVMPKNMSIGNKVLSTTGLMEGAAYVDQRRRQTGSVSLDDVTIGAGVGIINGVIEKYSGGTARAFDLESMANGLNTASRSAIKQLPGTILHDSMGEIVQENVSNIANNMQDGNALMKGSGQTSVDAVAISAGSTTTNAIPSLVLGAGQQSGKAASASKSLADKAFERVKKSYQDKTDPYDFETHSEPVGDNYQPVRAFNESMGKIVKAASSEDADAAQKEGQAVLAKASKRLMELRDVYQSAETPEAKEAAKKEVTEFINNYYNPLQQARKAFDNTGQKAPEKAEANKATGASYVEQQVTEMVERNKAKAAQNTTATPTVAPTTTTGTNTATTSTPPNTVSSGGNRVIDMLTGSPAQITSGTGKRTAPKAGASTNHDGIDIKAAENTPIRAPMGGTVVGMTENAKGGKQLAVRLANGYTIGFAHLNERGFKPGDKVKAGDVIAFSGNTGNSTGAHIHFTVRDPSGKPIDPTTFTLDGDSAPSAARGYNPSHGAKNFDESKAQSILRTANNLGIDPNDLATIISFESAGTLNPGQRNLSGGSAVGLIQFMPRTAKSLGTTSQALASMSFDEQMQYVEKYFKQRGIKSGTTLAELYDAVSGVQKKEYVKGTPEYDQNKVWDANGDGVISRGEAVTSKKFLEHKRNYFNGNGTVVTAESVPTQDDGLSELSKAREALATAIAIANRESIESIQWLHQKVEELKAEYKQGDEKADVNQVDAEHSKRVVVEASKQIRANTMDASHIDQLEAAGVISKADANELRRMLDIKRVIASQNTTDDVNDRVYEGHKGATRLESDLGLNNYQEILDDAIDSNDTATVNNYLGKLANFANNQRSKAEALEEALKLRPTNDNPVYIVPDKDNNWTVQRGQFATNSDDLAYAAGGFQVWQNNKTNDNIIQNATDVNALHDSYQDIVGNRQANGLLDSLDPKVVSSRTPKSKFANPSEVSTTSSTTAPTTTATTATTETKSQNQTSTYSSPNKVDSLTGTKKDIVGAARNTTDSIKVTERIEELTAQGMSAPAISKTINDELSAKNGLFDSRIKRKDDAKPVRLTPALVKNSQESFGYTEDKHDEWVNEYNNRTKNPKPVSIQTPSNEVKPKDLNETKKPKKPFNNTQGNVRTVSYNEAGSIKDNLAEDEVWLGHDYTKDSKGQTTLNKQAGTYKKGLSGFTNNNVNLQGKADSRSLAMGMFGEHGMFGNPYRTNAKPGKDGKENPFKVASAKEAVEKYVNMVKDMTTSTHGSRIQFLENLEQLRGKKLVTDANSKAEAQLLDHILNAPEAQPLWDKMADSNNADYSIAERKQMVDDLQEWIASQEVTVSETKTAKGKPIVTIDSVTTGTQSKADFRTNRKKQRKSEAKERKAKSKVSDKAFTKVINDWTEADFYKSGIRLEAKDGVKSSNSELDAEMDSIVDNLKSSVGRLVSEKGDIQVGVNSIATAIAKDSDFQLTELAQEQLVEYITQQRASNKSDDLSDIDADAQAMAGGEVNQPTSFTGDIDIDQINAEIVALQDNEDLSDIEADFQSMLSEEQESTEIVTPPATTPKPTSKPIKPKGNVKNRSEVAPSKMLSQKELDSKITLSENQTIDMLEEHLSISLDLAVANPIDKVLDKIVIDGTVAIDAKNEAEFNYLKSLILTMANYMDKPKIKINPKTKQAIYNPETDTIEVAISDTMFADIAKVIIKQSTLDIAGDIDIYEDGMYESAVGLSTEFSELFPDKDLDYVKKIKGIANKLKQAKAALNRDLLTKNLDALNLDSETRRAIYVLANGNLGDLLSVGLINEKVRDFLKTVTYKNRGNKSKSSLYRYIADAFKQFFGFVEKEANVLDTLLSVLGDVAEIKLQESDFSSTTEARQKVFDVTQRQIDRELKKDYKTHNRFIVSFTQKADRPLSTIKDLVNKLAQDPVKAAHFILGEHINPAQAKEVKYFADFTNKFTIYLKASFDSNVKLNKDLKNYLYDKNGNLDSNLATAMSLAVYSYVAANGNKTLNTFDDVKNLLNVDKDSDVAIPGEIYRQYAYLGNISSYVASDLGKVIVDALGISETGEAARGSLSELEMSLGNWALYAMQTAELGSLEAIDADVHLANINAVGGVLHESALGSFEGTNKQYTFFTFKAHKDAVVSSRAVEISKMSKGTQGIVGRLFNTETNERFPVLKAPTKVKRKIKKSGSLIGNLQATFMEKMQSAPIEIDTTTYDVMDNLLNTNGNWFKHLIGAQVTPEELAEMHVNDRLSAQAAAESLEREIEHGMGFAGSLKRTAKGFQDFWDKVYGARNNRMHFNSNIFNMQSSIVQRMLGSYKNFRTSIEMEGITSESLLNHVLDDNGKPTKLGLFLSAVAMNMEDYDSNLKDRILEDLDKYYKDKSLKNFTKDKVESRLFMPAFVKLLQSDEVQNAVSAMQKVIDGKTINAADRKAIETFVNKGGMGMQSVRALIEITNLMKAMQTGKPLSTAIGLGSDGINNGIALGSVYNGTATERVLMQTGFIPKNDKDIANQFDTKLDKNIGDYYEAFAEALTDHMKLLREGTDAPVIAKLFQTIETLQPAFDFVKNPKAARKFAKQLIIPFGYSAGIKRLVQVAQETFITDIQKKMAKLANDPKITKDSAEYIEFEKQLQTLLGNDTFKLPENPKELLEFWFDNKQLATISSVYDKVVGEALKNALNDFAAEFAYVRNRNIQMHAATFNLFNNIRQNLIDKATKELMGELNMTAKEFAERGFTNNEWEERVEKPLRNVTPKIATAFSTTQGDNIISDAIDSIDEINSGVEVFARDKQFKGGKVDSKVRGATPNRTMLSVSNQLPAIERIIKAVGVFVNSAQIQGTDARISAAASAMLGLLGIVNLNIHDQNDAGLDHYVDMVLAQNKATFNVLATNHLQLNSLSTLVDTLVNFKELMDKGLLKESEYNDILETLFIDLKSDFISPRKVMQQLIEGVRRTENDKLAILEDLEAVHQYAGELGEYKVTDKDRELVNKQRSKVSKELVNLSSVIEEMFPEYTENHEFEDLSEATIHSGGAVGADSIWGNIGNAFGINKQNHYYIHTEDDFGNINNPPLANTLLSDKDETIGAYAAALAARFNYDYRYPKTNDNLLRRNYAQVKYADTVFAIGSIAAPGDKLFPNKKKDDRLASNHTVTGGTGYAVAMAILMGKPIYVFNQEANSFPVGWFKYDYTNKTFVEVDTPILTKNFAGIGSRQINKEGVQAIVDVMQLTQQELGIPITEFEIDASKVVKEAKKQSEAQDSEGTSEVLQKFLQPNDNFKLITPKDAEKIPVSKKIWVMRGKDKAHMNSQGMFPGRSGWLGNPFETNRVNKNSNHTDLTATEAFLEAIVNKIAKDTKFATSLFKLGNRPGEQYLQYFNPKSKVNHALVIGSLLNLAKDSKDVSGFRTKVQNLFNNVEAVVETPPIPVGTTKPVAYPIDWVKSTIKKLHDGLDTHNGNSTYQLELMEFLITRTLETNPDINLEIADQAMFDKFAKKYPHLEGAKGVYAANINTIYVLDSELARTGDSGFSTMVNIMHELVHAITENQINSSDPEIKEVVVKLDEMRKQLLTVPNQPQAVATALESVSEFVAYGMTHPIVRDFIAKNLKNPDKSKLKNPRSILRNFLEKAYSLLGFDKKGKENFGTFVRYVEKLSIPLPKNIPPTDPKNTPPTGGKGKVDVRPNVHNASHLTWLSSGNVSATHNAQLDKIIGMIETFTANDTNRDRKVQKAQKTKTPMNMVNLLGMSDKEASVYESVKAVLDTYVATQGNNLTVRELHAMVREMTSGQMTKEDFVVDWATATPQERAQATALYSVLFGNTKANLKTDVVVKFTALALSSEKFRESLDRARSRLPSKEESSHFNTAMNGIESVINKLGEFHERTSNKNLLGQIDRLFYNLQTIDEKAKENKERLSDELWKGVGIVGDVANTATLKTLASAMRLVQGFPNKKVSEWAKLGDEFFKNDSAQVGSLLLDVSSKYSKLAGKRYGEGRNLVNEIVHTSEVKKVHERIVRFTNTLGQFRQKVQDNTREVLLEGFTNKGKDLSRQVRDSISTVMLRSDIASLLPYTSITEVMSLLSDDAKRTAKIIELESTIYEMPDGNAMLIQSKALAAYMITNKGNSKLNKSAQLIAARHGLESEIPLSKVDKHTYELVNSLVSLYAVNYGKARAGGYFDSIVKSEATGLKAMLKVHEALIERSKADFQSNPYNYTKGYLPNISDPNRSLIWVEPQDVDEMLKQGWQRVSNKPLKRDKHDTTFDRIMLYHPHMDYQDRVSGGLDMIDTHSKGQVVYADSADLVRVTKAKASENQAFYAKVDYRDYNPFAEEAALIPNYAADGSILDYHYEMESFLRDNYLQRNNDPFALLSRMDAKTQFKPQIEESQRSVAKALYEDYMANYAKNPELFVILDPDSLDPKVRDDYALTPYAFKLEAHGLFGKGNPIVVRASVYNTVFGYRVYSLGNIFNKNPKNMNQFEKFFFWIMGTIFNDKAKGKVIAIEDFIKTATKYAKDMIVIRGYKVLVGNIIANTFLLMLRGVNPVDIMKGYNYAWQEGKRYRDAEKRAMQIKTKLMYANDSQKADLRRQLRIEEDYMKRSSMHEYMQNGIMSTIVEDVTVLKDELAYKTKLEGKIDSFVEKIPSKVKTPLDWLMVNEGTPIHKFMSDATQFSDFSAKYVLAEHLRKGGMNFQEALSQAQESFINFDLPQGQGMDYMGRMGMFMFTKFFLRFQRVLAKLMWEKPAQTIAQAFIADSLLNMQSVLDPLVFNNIDNPFDWGAATLISGHETVSTELASLVF